ncbi:MAG: hypothetical protein HN639_03755 [Candidatus Thioglobus sp.]|jgi:fumarate hydratase class II/high-affinity iron transporter|nr:hypothetical protein [Candidatus Thioglobus sp.]
MKKILIFLSFLMIQTGAMAESWTSMANDIVMQINSAEKLYIEGKSKEANREIIKAYFGTFEDKKMEAAVRVTIGSKHAWKVERLFGKMRKLIKKSASKEDVGAIANKIRHAVVRDAKVLEEKKIPLEVFNPDK